VAIKPLPCCLQVLLSHWLPNPAVEVATGNVTPVRAASPLRSQPTMVRLRRMIARLAGQGGDSASGDCTGPVQQAGPPLPHGHSVHAPHATPEVLAAARHHLAWPDSTFTAGGRGNSLWAIILREAKALVALAAGADSEAHGGQVSRQGRWPLCSEALVEVDLGGGGAVGGPAGGRNSSSSSRPSEGWGAPLQSPGVGRPLGGQPQLDPAAPQPLGVSYRRAVRVALHVCSVDVSEFVAGAAVAICDVPLQHYQVTGRVCDGHCG
jgi:hypothetical protein